MAVYQNDTESVSSGEDANKGSRQTNNSFEMNWTLMVAYYISFPKCNNNNKQQTDRTAMYEKLYDQQVVWGPVFAVFVPILGVLCLLSAHNNVRLFLALLAQLYICPTSRSIFLAI